MSLRRIARLSANLGGNVAVAGAVTGITLMGVRVCFGSSKEREATHIRNVSKTWSQEKFYRHPDLLQALDALQIYGEYEIKGVNLKEIVDEITTNCARMCTTYNIISEDRVKESLLKIGQDPEEEFIPTLKRLGDKIIQLQDKTVRLMQRVIAVVDSVTHDGVTGRNIHYTCQRIEEQMTVMVSNTQTYVTSYLEKRAEAAK